VQCQQLSTSGRGQGVVTVFARTAAFCAFMLSSQSSAWHFVFHSLLLLCVGLGSRFGVATLCLHPCLVLLRMESKGDFKSGKEAKEPVAAPAQARPTPKLLTDPLSWDVETTHDHLKAVLAEHEMLLDINDFAKTMKVDRLDGKGLFSQGCKLKLEKFLLQLPTKKPLPVYKRTIKSFLDDLHEPKRSFDEGYINVDATGLIFSIADSKIQFLNPLKEHKAGNLSAGMNRFQSTVFDTVRRRWLNNDLGYSDSGERIVTGIVMPTGSGKTLVEGILPYAIQCKGAHRIRHCDATSLFRLTGDSRTGSAGCPERGAPQAVCSQAGTHA
jgi:hypothetical protein